MVVLPASLIAFGQPRHQRRPGERRDDEGTDRDADLDLLGLGLLGRPLLGGPLGRCRTAVLPPASGAPSGERSSSVASRIDIGSVRRRSGGFDAARYRRAGGGQRRETDVAVGGGRRSEQVGRHDRRCGSDRRRRCGQHRRRQRQRRRRRGSVPRTSACRHHPCGVGGDIGARAESRRRHRRARTRRMSAGSVACVRGSAPFRSWLCIGTGHAVLESTGHD